LVVALTGVYLTMRNPMSEPVKQAFLAD
jgi:hypothetical protein